MFELRFVGSCELRFIGFLDYGIVLIGIYKILVRLGELGYIRFPENKADFWDRDKILLP